MRKKWNLIGRFDVCIINGVSLYEYLKSFIDFRYRIFGLVNCTLLSNVKI
jgi:hypothetical protein